MPVAATVRLLSTVVPSGDHRATLLSTVEGGQAPATLLSTVSRSLVNSCEAPSIRTGYKIRLAGEWIPDADQVEATHDWNRDTPVEFLSFSLIGGAARHYATLRTLETWSQQEVEYWVVNGPPGAEREELRFAGYVLPGGAEEKAGAGGPGFSIRIRATNRIGRFGDQELCREIEPLYGKSRGWIMRELCADAGLTAVDFPDGEIYTKGILAKNTKLLPFLLSFVEPEGWTLREIPRPFADGGPILTARREQPAAPPLPSDDRWDLSRVPSFELRPPSDVVSRYITRGYGAVFVDELGQETKVNVVEVYDLYAPKVATHRQDTSGVLNPTGYPALSASLRRVQMLVDTQVMRGSKLISQDTEEYGWYNARAARLVTNPPDYDFRDVLVDETGEFVAWPYERFVRVGWRRVEPVYDVDGTAIGAMTEVWGWRLRTAGVMEVGDATPSISGVYVFGDSISYAEPAEVFSRAEIHEEAREYDEATGAERMATVRSSAYRARRSAVGPGTIGGLYVRSDGQGQNEPIATWREFARRQTVNVVGDGTLLGTIEREYDLDTYRVLAGYGEYTWGDFDSNALSEDLILSGYKVTQYNVLATGAEGFYERVTYQNGQKPERVVLSGRVPQPRYKAGAWTYLRQEPIEVVQDDPVAQQLFGFRREVIQNDHIQSQAEALRVIQNRRRRDRAHQARLSRHETHLRRGATVFLVRPDNALQHRGWLVQGSERRSRAEPAQVGTYTFEVAGL